MTEQLISIDPSKPIGIIGAGLMGKAVGQRLIEHGYTVVVWNRNRPEAEPLLHHGAIWSDNPLRDCQRMIVCLFNSQIALQVLGDFSDALRSNQVAPNQIVPDQIIIDMTTGTPADAEKLAKQFRDRQVHYLDAPVSGSSEQTLKGQAMIMVGGEHAAYAACADLWSVLARSIHFTGINGSASRMKLVTNLVLGLNRAALAEGLAFAKTIGVDPEAALHVMQDSAAASRVMDVKGRKMIERDFSVQARLSQHLKDVRLILELAMQESLELPLSQTHQRLLEKAESSGCGDLDNSAIVCAYDKDNHVS
jgi:3-hydroxyisobutyrate dehydrogenase-like beta-hydroxyacid dehydrogenase